MPIEADFFDHLVMPSLVHHSLQYHKENDDVDDNTGENVESVEPCDEEEEIAESLLLRVFAFFEVGTKSVAVAA